MKYLLTLIAAIVLSLGAHSAFAQDRVKLTPEQNQCIITCATDEAQCRDACGEDEGCKDLCSTDAKQCAAECLDQ